MELSVHDLLGQKVRTLMDGCQAAGHETVRWDRTDEEGSPVASGIHFLRVQAGDVLDAEKTILIR